MFMAILSVTFRKEEKPETTLLASAIFPLCVKIAQEGNSKEYNQEETAC
jgi:hypothetical protein